MVTHQKVGVAWRIRKCAGGMLALMTTRARMGRPSKGERRIVTTRLPLEVDALVNAEAAARGCSKSEVVAALVARQLGKDAPLPEPTPMLDSLSA